MTAQDSPTGTAANGVDVEIPHQVDKPWGHEIIWALTDRYCGKVLHVEAGEALSLQYHERKDETLYLLRGVAEIESGPLGGELTAVRAEAGWALHVTARTVHRLRAVETCDFLEVSTPDLDDVVRLEDRYGR
jgi:mannose-6-phosphate isomerase-like protein (cupin superfamily)